MMRTGTYELMGDEAYQAVTWALEVGCNLCQSVHRAYYQISE